MSFDALIITLAITMNTIMTTWALIYVHRDKMTRYNGT